MDWDEMSNLYRGPSKDASYQVGRSSIKNAHFVPIGWQTWPPQAILVSDRLISKNDGHQVMAKAHIAFGKVC
jgi:hypothetical protein